MKLLSLMMMQSSNSPESILKQQDDEVEDCFFSQDTLIQSERDTKLRSGKTCDTQ